MVRGVDHLMHDFSVISWIIFTKRLHLPQALLFVFLVVPYYKQRRAEEKVEAYRDETMNVKRGPSVANAAYESVPAAGSSMEAMYAEFDPVASGIVQA